MEGASPLLIALQYRHPPIALLLLHGGSGVYSRESGERALVNLPVPKDGSTPLFAAAGEGYTEVIDLLIGYRYLLIEGYTEVIDVLRTLYSYTTLIHFTHTLHPYTTPIHSALPCCTPQVIDALLKSGAGIDPANRHGATPLSHAVVKGHFKAVQRMLKAGANVNAKLNDGTTCLHAALSSSAGASSSSRRKIVSQLLDSGASLASSDSGAGSAGGAGGDAGGVSALMMLASGPTDDAKMATLLLKHASVRDSVDLQSPASRGGRTALMMAAERGHVELLKILVKAPARASLELLSSKTGATALMLAAMRGQAGAVEVLAKAGANVNARGDSEAMYEATALYLAAQGKRTDVAKVLLRHGAEVDPTLRQIEVTPLFMAAERGDEAMVRLLVAGGADPLRTNWNMMTPFAMASVRGNLGCMRALLPALSRDQGQDQDQDQYQAAADSAWVMLSGAQKDGSVSLLCACGGCAEEEVQEGQPKPPHPSGASERRIFEPVVSFLLDRIGQLAAANATIAARALEVVGGGNDAGVAPLMAAAELGWTKAVKMVLTKLQELAKMADKGNSSVARWLDHRRSSDQSTALLAAAARGHVEVVRQLLRAGADYSLVDADGDRPMEKARRARDFDLINAIGRYDEAGAEAAPAGGAGGAAGGESSAASAEQATASAGRSGAGVGEESAGGECGVEDEMIDLDLQEEVGGATIAATETEEQGGPHALLGVTKAASLKEIKAAYRALSRQYHPDKLAQQGRVESVTEGAVGFEAISSAYQQLVAQAEAEAGGSE
jgi:ankyrin repeat protein